MPDAEGVETGELKQEGRLICPVQVNGDYFEKDGERFLVKSVSYNPYYPGETLADTPRKADMRQDMEWIRDAHVNTLLLYRLGSNKLYEHALEAGLYLMQGISVPTDTEDYQDESFRKRVKRSIRWQVDQLNRDLKPGSRAVEQRIAERVICYWIGGEFPEETIGNTDTRHPEISSYTGRFVSAPEGSTASECFVAEICDYLMAYEQDTYGYCHYATHINWPVTAEIMPLSFLPVVLMDIYPYWPAQVSCAGRGDFTATSYQAYLEGLKERYAGTPLVVSEFGFPTAPDRQALLSFTEEQQAENLIRCWVDMMTASRPIAGGNVFEWNDEWWKQAASAERHPVDHDKSHHESDDYEEWFGIVAVERSDSGKYTARRKPAYEAVSQMYAAEFDSVAWHMQNSTERLNAQLDAAERSDIARLP